MLILLAEVLIRALSATRQEVESILRRPLVVALCEPLKVLSERISLVKHNSVRQAALADRTNIRNVLI